MLHDLADEYHGRVGIEVLDIYEPDQLAALKQRLSGRSLDIPFVNAGTTNRDSTQTIGEVLTEDFMKIGFPVQPDFDTLRHRFLHAAQTAGARVTNFAHPLKGPKGEALTTDVAWLGNPDARTLRNAFSSRLRSPSRSTCIRARGHSAIRY
ncbi:DUF2817 domain-containing protein [Paraburkholderia phymatum]|uniref:DUF2817 domain-containing protein n=1 Tax=Paraburkholderia phymatum TaxID=148447 RepID=UPI0000E7C26D|nr:DUF2817 domain-containing protein [Paraburkholderia phymatum]